ncbi:MAG: thioredoxin family protein [Clostridia bacterium]|jgi:protein-disulfide isomerase|nr:thioredoxin family protein [Clostridia bacterium]
MEVLVINGLVCSCEGKQIEMEKVIMNIDKAIDMLGETIKVTISNSFDDIIKYGVKRTPGIVINGNLKFSGRIPSSEELFKEMKQLQ